MDLRSLAENASMNPARNFYSRVFAALNENE